MLLATYQPIEPRDDHRDPRYACFREKLGGEYPVFCLPARTADEFRFRSLLASPCKPERLVIFETSDYVRFDAVVWNNISALPRDDAFARRFDDMFEDVDERFSEYAVTQDALRDPLLSVDLAHLVEAGAVVPDARGIGGKANAMLEILCGRARESAHDGLSRWHPRVDDRFDRESVIYQTAFVHYLSGVLWCSGTGSTCSPIEFIPLAPMRDDAVACDAERRFDDLRYKVFDTLAGGTHAEYLGMCDALACAIGEGRRRFLSAYEPDGPCPCGSGRRLRECHLRHPVDLFPFERGRW